MDDHTERLNSEKVLTLLKEIESNSHLTQRYLSQKLAISLGKINFLIRALVDKGLVEIKNFQESKNKLGYVYLLTPKGLNTKVHLTQQFFDWKTKEYERLREEIEALKKEITIMPQQENISAEETRSGFEESLTEGIDK